VEREAYDTSVLVTDIEVFVELANNQLPTLLFEVEVGAWASSKVHCVSCGVEGRWVTV
jgi:hypothetical protein